MIPGDIYGKPAASPADGSSKNPLKHVSSWGRGNSTPGSTAKSAKVDHTHKTASFEQFQKLAKEKEEKVRRGIGIVS